MDVILDIFETVQQSTAKHSPILLKKMLWMLSKSDMKDENIKFFLNGCIDKVLLSPKINTFVLRTINFVAKLTSSFDDELMMEMMRHLCSRLTSSNKTVRQIVCQIIADTMAHMKESDIPMSCDLLSEVATFLTTRLQDKTPTVRLWAVRALKYTQDESSESDSSASALIIRIVSDSSAVVRLEALKSVLIRKNVIPHICSRLRDVRPEIRIAALSRLAECHSRNVKQVHRLQVIQLCLTDRDPQVSAAGVKLVMTWVARLAESCSYNEAIEKLIKGLGPVHNEEVALLLGSTLVEELLRSDVQQVYDENLKDAVRTGRGVVWNGDIADISAHSILWVYVRCNYARQFCPVLAATEICDFLLPSAADIARLLGEASEAESGFASEDRQFVVKYLLRVAQLLVASSTSTVLTSAAADCARLVLNECQSLFVNLRLPADLLEPALKTFYALRCTTSSNANVQTETRDLLLSTIRTMASAEQEQPNHSSACERALQIAFWLIQQEVGTRGCSSVESGKDGPISGASELTQLVPFVLSCVQQENPVIRCGAVGCLGLLCLLSREVSAEYRHVLAQVASNGVEASAIRREALKCLVDAACVHRDQFFDDAGLCTVLLRAQQQHRNGDSLGLVAMEGAAKLLFCGVVREPELLANLLHFFFHSDNPSRCDDDDDEICDDDAATRLHQLLSLFLQAFLLSGDSSVEVVVEAVPQLVASITESIKHEDAKASSLAAAINTLLALCSNVPQGASSAGMSAVALQIQERVAGGVCRELLKLGSTKSDKAIVKEYSKLISTLAIQDIATPEKAVAMRVVFQAVLRSVALDKASQKIVTGLVALCSNVPGAIEESTTEGEKFMSSVSGLAGMVALVTESKEGDEDDSAGESEQDAEVEVAANKKISSSRAKGGSASGKARRVTAVEEGSEDDSSKDDESDSNSDSDNDDDDMSESDVNVAQSTGRRVPSRSSKLTASKKIAAQLAE